MTSTSPLQISAAAARRITLAAQGFVDSRFNRPVRPEDVTLPTIRQVQRVIDQLGIVQIDSVNVLTRSQYLPFYSRLGPYDPALLDRARDQTPRRVIEYWAHAASLIPPSTVGLLRWRMARARDEAWGGMRQAEHDHPGLTDVILAEIADHGPITAVELERVIARDAPLQRQQRTEWGWNWSVVKRLLELLFWAGEVASAGRNSQFARLYDLPDRVLPQRIWHGSASPDQNISEAEAHRGLVVIAARAFGIASETCLRDYFRLAAAPTRTAIAELVADGELVPAQVHGWQRPTYLHAEARRPRRVQARALVSPFDSLIWERARTRALFGFDYRIEIYVPAPKRRYGYYVLPFLLGDRLVARVDLKADRQAADGAGVLRVQSAHAEPAAEVDAAAGAWSDIAAELVAELHLMAYWLGLSRVESTGRGDLGPALAEHLQ